MAENSGLDLQFGRSLWVCGIIVLGFGTWGFCVWFCHRRPHCFGWVMEGQSLIHALSMRAWYHWFANPLWFGGGTSFLLVWLWVHFLWRWSRFDCIHRPPSQVSSWIAPLRLPTCSAAMQRWWRILEQGSAAGGCDMGKQNNLTLPETNGLPLKNDGWKMIFFDFLLGWPIFWGYVSLRECMLATCFFLYSLVTRWWFQVF